MTGPRVPFCPGLGGGRSLSGVQPQRWAGVQMEGKEGASLLVGLGRVGPGFRGQGPSRCSLSPQLPWVCEEGAGTPVVLQGHIDCGSLLGHRAVYRMCFATAAFFFLFTLLMLCVRSSRDPRAAIQNG